MGYAVSWGIFSAREVGAPHQRKRVFILAHRDGERGQLSDWWKLAAESLSVSDGETRRAWPSRPGQPQHGFEPPRVVIGRMANANGTQPSEGRGNHAEVPQVSAGEWADDSAIVSGGESEHRGEGMGNANNIDRGTSTGGRINDAEAGSAGESVGNTAEQGCQRSRRTNDSRGELSRPTESNGGCAYRTMEQSERQTKPSLGGDAYGTTSGMGYAELCESCDNRTDELRLLGNGVVPATATLAFQTLLAELLTL